MSFWDTVGSKVKSTGNQISDRAKDTGEQMKLNNEISTLNKQVQIQYQKLGEMYYSWMRSGEAAEQPDFESVCSAIDVLKVQIQNRQDRITSIRAQIVCPSCGKMVPPDMKFCPYCGTPLTEEEKAKEAARRAEEARRAAEAIRQRQATINEAGPNAGQNQNSQEDGSTSPAGTGQKMYYGAGFCQYCGAPLEPDAKFCVKCGHPVELPEENMKAEDDQTGANPSAGADIPAGEKNSDDARTAMENAENISDDARTVMENADNILNDTTTLNAEDSAPAAEDSVSSDSLGEGPQTGDGQNHVADHIPPAESDETASEGKVTEEVQEGGGTEGNSSSGNNGNADAFQFAGFCSYCGAPLEPGAKFCMVCGHVVDED